MPKAKLFIGTSGFSYSHWEDGVFYPKDLPKTKELEYLSRKFNTVEINSSFYHLPSEKSFCSWKKRTPKDFIFSLKVSRYITHIKKLSNCQKEWRDFLKRALLLEKKLGPFLFQLPPSFKKDTERLKSFIELLEKTASSFRFVFEFRHPSWFSKDVYEVLKRGGNTALCFIDSPRWESEEVVTADFVYIRMHGSKSLYSSNYSQKELKSLAEKIRDYLKKGLDVYVYFNNDAFGFAPKNAFYLKGVLLKEA